MPNISNQQIELITKLAVETALDHLEKSKRELEKKRSDRRLRNIKMLLKNYRSFKLHCLDIKLDINRLQQLVELDSIDTDSFAVESIMKSKKRTRAMVAFIDQMLEVYRVICEQSTRAEERRRFESVYHLYISDKKMSASKLAAGHNTNIRTVYKDVDIACKTLSTLIFGVDALNLEG